MFERFWKSWRTRATVKLLDGVPVALTDSVWMFRKPTFVLLPTFPDRRPPPRIGICSPLSPIPIRRLKNTSI